MKKSDLYREWARVLDMCEGTVVDPYSCVKRAGVGCDWYVIGKHTELDPVWSFKFAVAILEGKPVFVGDEFYCKDGGKLRCEGNHIRNISGFDKIIFNFDAPYLKSCSWNPPKKTFMLNGEVLPCPGDNKPYGLVISGNGTAFHRFSSCEERKKVEDAINKLLKESTGNGE